jgi:serine/threonine-protein kinase
MEEAERVFATALRHNEALQEPAVPILAAYLYASRGERQRIDPAVFAPGPEESYDGDQTYWLAGVFALLGEQDRALVWLRRAVELGNHNYPWFSRDRNFDQLRGHPEYERILGMVRREWDRYRGLFGRQS